MKKQTTFIIFIFLSFSIFSQTKEELEYELSYFISGETHSDKIEYARKLLKLDPLNINAIDFIYSYYNEREIDSISLFFNELKRKHQDKEKVFLLGAELISYYEWFHKEEYTLKRIEHLDSALFYDSDNKKAIFYLAETYYTDFIRPLYLERTSLFSSGDPVQDSIFMDERRKKRKSFIEHSADSALMYLYKSWKLDENRRDVIYFPIKQLESYLGIIDTSHVTMKDIPLQSECYFPSWYFMPLNKNWQFDYTYNYLHEAQLSKSNSVGLTKRLIDLEEPCLYCKEAENKEFYRFTWLRTFDNPITIRIEKSVDKVTLFWKVGNGSAGYDLDGVKRKGKKKLKKKDWERFTSLVEKSEFNQLPNEEYVAMVDGASWTLEYKSPDGFKAHETNDPKRKFKNCCLYLLKLSGIRVKKDRIY